MIETLTHWAMTKREGWKRGERGRREREGGGGDRGEVQREPVKEGMADLFGLT